MTMRRLVGWACAIAFGLCMATPLGALAQQALSVADSRQGASFQSAASKRVSPLERPARLTIANATLASGLTALHQRSGVALAFSPSQLPTGAMISCSCASVSVAQALDSLLAGYALRYAVMDAGLVLIEPSDTDNSVDAHASSSTGLASGVAVLGSADAAFAGQISGRVTAAGSNQPIEGAQVTIAGTGLGAITDEEGRYVITNVDAGTHNVRAQRIGYTPVTRSVTLAADAAVTLDFALTAVSISLDEVVVTGTAGQARRREVGNSIGTINAEQLQFAPRTTVSDVLQGQVAGVQQFANEGQVGSGTTISIRGISSLTQGSEPLIYVDGVRMNNATYMANTFTRSTALGNPGPNGAQNSPKPLDNLNPDDILRVEVIRGPAATTLYGTEAAAGVVQIFTKRGQTASAASWSLVAREGARFQTGNGLGPVVGKDPTYVGLKKFLRTGEERGVDLSVNGGSDVIRYFLSGSYGYSEGVLDKNDSRRLGLRGNFGFQPLKSLAVDVNSTFSNRKSSFLESGDNTYGFLLNVLRGTQDYTGGKHEMLFDIDNLGTTDHFVGGVTLTHTRWSSLTNRLTLGIDYTNSFNAETFPFEFPLLPMGQRNTSQWLHRTLTMDYVSTWSHNFGSKVTSALSVGGQYFQDLDHTQLGTAEGFGGPGDPTLSSGATSRASETQLTVVNAGLFVQELLGFHDKYFLTLGARIDGNSAFGQDLGLQAYPKVSASYVISEEGFWPDWWQVMKLRGAWGEAGKAPGAFDAVRTWTPVAGYNGQPGVTPQNIGNADLGPERSRELELGFESSVLGGRISADLTWYRKTTDDALFRVTAPPSLGFLLPPLKNVGTIENRGVELSVTGVPISRQSFNWSVTAQYSTNTSEVLDLGGAPPFTVGFASLGQWVREGYPVVAAFGRKVTNPNAMADPIYADDQYLGPIYPTFNYGLSTTITFAKRFSVHALAEGAGGHVALNNMPWQAVRRDLWPECNSRQDLASQPAIWRARCGKPLPDREAWIRDADYLKLRNVSVTYQLPSALIPGANSTSLTLLGQNLWKWQRHPGLDPELTRGGTYSVFPARYEYYQMPPAQLVSLTARVTF